MPIILMHGDVMPIMLMHGDVVVAVVPLLSFTLIVMEESFLAIVPSTNTAYYAVRMAF